MRRDLDGYQAMEALTRAFEEDKGMKRGSCQPETET